MPRGQFQQGGRRTAVRTCPGRAACALSRPDAGCPGNRPRRFDRDALGQVQLDRDIDCFSVVEFELEGDAVLARFLIGHQVELVNLQPGEQGHHDGAGAGVARVITA